MDGEYRKGRSSNKILTWCACHELKNVWTSKISKKVKIKLYLVTVEFVLFYGTGTWTSTKNLEKQIDETYTKLLGMVLKISWRSHTSNTNLYQDLPKITTKIKRRMRLAGHCSRHPEEVAHKLVFWQSTKEK